MIDRITVILSMFILEEASIVPAIIIFILFTKSNIRLPYTSIDIRLLGDIADRIYHSFKTCNVML